jgi:2-iminobutanoate/2-iminopropanoate deaminase
MDADTGMMVNNNIEEETKKVMHNLENLLREAGSNFSKVIKTTIFLKDMDDFTKVNSIYASYFEDNFPARETVQVSRLPKDASVEISMIAFKE